MTAGVTFSAFLTETDKPVAFERIPGKKKIFELTRQVKIEEKRTRNDSCSGVGERVQANTSGSRQNEFGSAKKANFDGDTFLLLICTALINHTEQNVCR